MQFLKSYEEFIKKNNAFIIKVERDTSVEPSRSERNKYLNFLIRIYIDIDSAKKRDDAFYTLEDISFVKYELHPSYKERFRISEDFQNKFELKVWTYGFYPIKATVYLKYGKPLTISGNVQFAVSPDEKRINGEELEPVRYNWK